MKFKSLHLSCNNSFQETVKLQHFTQHKKARLLLLQRQTIAYIFIKSELSVL